MFGEGSEFALSVSRERQTRLDIFFREVREIRENFFLAHAAGEIFQHVRYSHSGSANGRLAASLARLDTNNLAVIHGRNDNKTDSSCKIAWVDQQNDSISH